MKKSVKKLLVIAVMVMLTLCCSTTAQAKATRKKVTLTVNKTYAGAKKVKGKVTVKKGKIKGYKVKAQIAKKNKKGKYKYKKKVYTAKVNKKAKYTIKKMPKLKKGWKIRVKLYKGKKKVKTKVIKVKAKKSVTKGNYEPEITMAYYNRVMNDVDRLKKAKKAGGDITESMGMLFISRKATKSTPGCLIRQDGTYGIGPLLKYMKTEANGLHASFTAINGATIYGRVSDGTTYGRVYDDLKNPTPEDYDFKITSGQTKTYQGTDFERLPTYGLFYKVAIYKNDKWIGVDYNTLHLVEGYNDDMAWKFTYHKNK